VGLVWNSTARSAYRMFNNQGERIFPCGAAEDSHRVHFVNNPSAPGGDSGAGSGRIGVPRPAVPANSWEEHHLFVFRSRLVRRPFTSRRYGPCWTPNASEPGLLQAGEIVLLYDNGRLEYQWIQK
jgi:hypothetical protein